MIIPFCCYVVMLLCCYAVFRFFSQKIYVYWLFSNLGGAGDFWPVGCVWIFHNTITTYQHVLMIVVGNKKRRE